MKTAPRSIESALHAQGYALVGGVDEAGRGPLAGPVCAAVVVFDPGTRIRGVNDSKLLEPSQREDLFPRIQAKAIAVGIGLACAEEIDAINILRATKLAVRRALRQLPVIPDFLLLDALHIERCTIPQQAYIQGDSRCFSIAAASIIAKVTRDRLMHKYAREFPSYNFDQHKGYATPTHRKALNAHGPCTLHRQSFLGQWFGTTTRRPSAAHELLLQQLNRCRSDSELHDLADRLSALKDFLPKCEITALQTLAQKRMEEIQTKAPPPPNSDVSGIIPYGEK